MYLIRSPTLYCLCKFSAFNIILLLVDLLILVFLYKHKFVNFDLNLPISYSSYTTSNHHWTHCSYWFDLVKKIPIWKIIQYVLCCVWFVSLSKMSSRPFHVITNRDFSFFKTEQYYHNYLSVPTSIDTLVSAAYLVLCKIMMQWTWECRYFFKKLCCFQLCS